MLTHPARASCFSCVFVHGGGRGVSGGRDRIGNIPLVSIPFSTAHKKRTLGTNCSICDFGACASIDVHATQTHTHANANTPNTCLTDEPPSPPPPPRSSSLFFFLPPRAGPPAVVGVEAPAAPRALRHRQGPALARGVQQVVRVDGLVLPQRRRGALGQRWGGCTSCIQLRPTLETVLFIRRETHSSSSSSDSSCVCVLRGGGGAHTPPGLVRAPWFSLQAPGFLTLGTET